MLIDKIKEAGEKLAAQKTALVEEAETTLAPALQEFIVSHPEIKAIRWRQYSPYFNDGEPCVFSLQGVEYQLANKEYGDEEDGDDTEWEYISWKPSNPIEAAMKEIEDTLNLNEDILEAVFGDGVQVIVTKDGIDVEDYDHD
mgnify:CR=1 FL=1